MCLHNTFVHLCKHACWGRGTIVGRVQTEILHGWLAQVYLITTMLFMLQANSYALGEIQHKQHLGFVLHGCGKTVEQSTVQPKLTKQRDTIRSALGFSSLFQIVFTFLATSMLLNKWLPQVAGIPSNLPTQVHSQFWAVCTAASMIWAMFASMDIYSTITTMSNHPFLVSMAIVLLLISVLIEAPVAVYFVKKYTIAVPGVYLVPTKVLCCCRKEKISALVVRAMFLLMTLMAIQLAFFHFIFILLAFGAAPFNIGSCVAMLLFLVFATVHILAILFTLPSLCRPPLAMGSVNKGEKCHAIIQAVSLVILLIAIFCFFYVVAQSAHLISIRMEQESFLLPLSKVVLPLGLGFTSMLLRRFSNMWWETLASRRLVAMPDKSVDEPMNSTAGYNTI